MLDYLGLQDVEQLFDDVPEDVRMERLNLRLEVIGEPEAVPDHPRCYRPNVTTDDMPSFLGSRV